MMSKVWSREIDVKLARIIAHRSMPTRKRGFILWLKAGGEEAIREFVTRQSGHNEFEVDDIVQDAIYRAMKYAVLRGKYDFRYISFTAYVKTIALNLIRKEANKHRRHIILSLDVLSERGNEPPDLTPIYTEVEQQIDLAHSLRKITRLQRDILLQELDGFSIAQISAALNISKAAIYKNHQRALEVLLNV